MDGRIISSNITATILHQSIDEWFRLFYSWLSGVAGPLAPGAVVNFAALVLGFGKWIACLKPRVMYDRIFFQKSVQITILNEKQQNIIENYWTNSLRPITLIRHIKYSIPGYPSGSKQVAQLSQRDRATQELLRFAKLRSWIFSHPFGGLGET